MPSSIEPSVDVKNLQNVQFVKNIDSFSTTQNVMLNEFVVTNKLEKSFQRSFIETRAIFFPNLL